MESSDDALQNRCFKEWNVLQEQDLSELLDALNAADDDGQPHGGEDGNKKLLNQLIESSIKHFQDYITKRANLAASDVSPFFAPKWCSSLEGSMLWIAGCRPSGFIRLIYAIMGKEIESGLEEYLRGMRNGKLGDVSARQMSMINSLQGKIVQEEDKLSAKLTSLQEDMADQPIALIANEASSLHEENEEAEVALDVHAKDMLTVLEAADNLRLHTLKELISILSPLQAVEFLAASKKLHICIHEWGGRRDDKHGRTRD